MTKFPINMYGGNDDEAFLRQYDSNVWDYRFNICKIRDTQRPERDRIMSQMITAVYEHGALHPLTPLGLRENQRVHVQIVPEEHPETIEHILNWLTRIGRISPPKHPDITGPCTDKERAQLAKALGKVMSKPLSESILDERGKW